MEINKLNPTMLIAALVVLVGLFFTLRELICWYYKINESIKLRKETNELLRTMLARMPHNATGNTPDKEHFDNK